MIRFWFYVGMGIQVILAPILYSRLMVDGLDVFEATYLVSFYLSIFCLLLMRWYKIDL